MSSVTGETKQPSTRRCSGNLHVTQFREDTEALAANALLNEYVTFRSSQLTPQQEEVRGGCKLVFHLEGNCMPVAVMPYVHTF